ncbi:putative oxidoreductase [bioreactor metagenome]|jgi:hypothetical protein|uniref:Putative oxidoreductase n=1 Tax=bioreactor metagenome TaxID=1076179 RepID=A0A644VMC2_9ZZZZ|nr:SDR family oxidoreductase [Lentimicrobium sp.]MEA5112241.1 SDR family oxidoreductase [Lentimicrobium sp.]
MKTSNGYALITGSSGGIGFDLAVLMASRGHNLILTARSEEKITNLARQLSKTHSIEAVAFAADLSVENDREKLLEFIRNNNYHIEILINNAGYGDLGPFEHADWDKTHQMIQLNITALTHLTRVLVPGMRKVKSGRILNVASVAAFMPGPLMSVYYASKAYVLSFSEALAEELRGSGITVTTLCPGPVATGFQDRAAFKDPALMKILKPATPAEVAEYGYKALIKGKRLAIHGLMNRFMIFSLRFSPRRMVLEMVKRLHQ